MGKARRARRRWDIQRSRRLQRQRGRKVADFMARFYPDAPERIGLTGNTIIPPEPPRLLWAHPPCGPSGAAALIRAIGVDRG